MKFRIYYELNKGYFIKYKFYMMWHTLKYTMYNKYFDSYYTNVKYYGSHELALDKINRIVNTKKNKIRFISEYQY